MRHCKYCGMPMEDDDLFCTRCGKAVGEKNEKKEPAIVPAGNPQRTGASVDKTQHVISSEERTQHVFSSGEETQNAGRAARRAAASGAARRQTAPRDDRDRQIRKNPMYGSSAAASDMEDDEEDGKYASTRRIMTAAIAVLAIVFCALLFMLFNPAGKNKDGSQDNEVAVYNNDSEEEQNLNQGQQTPASGQAAAASQDEDADVNTDASSRDTQDAQSSSGSAQNNAQDSSAAKQDEDADRQDVEAVEDEEEADEEEADEEEVDEEEADEEETGWVVDEDGNEVYYPEDDEAYTDSDQTQVGGGSVMTESEDVTIQSSEEEETEEEEPAEEKPAGVTNQSQNGPSALSGDNVTGDSSAYILPEGSSRYYTKDELEKLSDNQLQMAINELCARHGRQFGTDSIRQYFEGKSWYNGTVDAATFDANESQYLNEYESANKALMAQIRDQRAAASGTTAGQ